MIATKKTSEYDRAAALLHDLRALAKRQGEEAAFAKRVLDLRAQYRAGLACRIASTKRACPGSSAPGGHQTVLDCSMRPTSKRISFQAHVLSGFCHGSHCLVSNAVALNAVVSVIFFAMGIQSPTCRCWYSGRMRLALAEPTLSSRSS